MRQTAVVPIMQIPSTETKNKDILVFQLLNLNQFNSRSSAAIPDCYST